MSEPCNVYSIFVFFVIWFQCTLSLGSTFDAWGSWICVAKCCCVPYNVMCSLVLAALPVFCFSLNIALVDAWCAVWKCVTKNCVLCVLVRFCVPCVPFIQPTVFYCVGWCLRQCAGWIWVATININEPLLALHDNERHRDDTVEIYLLRQEDDDDTMKTIWQDNRDSEDLTI